MTSKIVQIPNSENLHPFKILSIEGGGIKGLYAAQLLANIEEKLNAPIGNYFDMICGTSTGGLIALGISCGIPCKKMSDFYREKGPLIFPRQNKIDTIIRCLRQCIFSTKYSNKQLESSLTSIFGHRTMKEANNLLCIPAFNMTLGRPCVFKKPFGPYHRDGRFTMVQVGMATSAAPTYLPSITIENNQYVDGGIFCNNPAMVGYTEAMDHFIGKSFSKNGDTMKYDNITMLSIGLPGDLLGENPFTSKTRSFIGWNKKLIKTAMSGTSYITDYQIKKLMEINGGEYYKINPPPLSSEHLKIVNMDNTCRKSLGVLLSQGKDIGETYTSTKWSTIKTFFDSNKTYQI